MSVYKKLSAAALAAVMTVSLCSCGKNAIWAAKINDYEVKAGIFINYQMNAYYEAVQKMTESDTDVFKLTIEDKPAKEWINDTATSNMQKFVAVEQKCDEIGITLSDDDKQSVNNYVEQMWEYYGSNLEGYGISQQSMLDVSLNASKNSALFNHFYGEGGEKEISKQEIVDYIYDNYAMIKYIEMPLKDAEGNLLKSDGKAEMLELANSYIEREKNGESFDDIIAEFKKDQEEKAAEANSDLTAEDALSSDDSAAAETTVETAEEIDNSVIIEKSGSTPNQAVVDKIFSGEVKIGDCFVVELDEIYYLVEFLDFLSVDGNYESTQDGVRHKIKDDEFNAYIDELIAAQNITKNEAAYKKYKAEKFVEDN